MAKNYTAQPIGNKTYLIEEKTVLNQGLCYLLLGEENALLIDTGLGYKDLADVVHTLTALPVVVAISHAHVDHIGGNHYFDEIWVHEKDKDIFKRHIDPKYTFHLLTDGMPGFLKPILKLATRKILQIDPSGNYHYFGDDHIFHLGGRDIEVIPTPGHTPGSVCFLDRANRMLFTADTVCEEGILLHFKGEGCPPEVFRDSIERLIALQDTYDTIWPGHHAFPVDKSFLEEYHTCISQVLDGTATYKEETGRLYACHGRIKISLQKE